MGLGVCIVTSSPQPLGKSVAGGASAPQNLNRSLPSSEQEDSRAQNISPAPLGVREAPRLRRPGTVNAGKPQQVASPARRGPLALNGGDWRGLQSTSGSPSHPPAAAGSGSPRAGSGVEGGGRPRLRPGPRGGHAEAPGPAPHRAEHIRAPGGCSARAARSDIDRVVITTPGRDQETIKTVQRQMADPNSARP